MLGWCLTSDSFQSISIALLGRLRALQAISPVCRHRLKGDVMTFVMPWVCNRPAVSSTCTPSDVHAHPAGPWLCTKPNTNSCMSIYCSPALRPAHRSVDPTDCWLQSPNFHPLRLHAWCVSERASTALSLSVHGRFLAIQSEQVCSALCISRGRSITFHNGNI